MCIKYYIDISRSSFIDNIGKDFRVNLNERRILFDSVVQVESPIVPYERFDRTSRVLLTLSDQHAVTDSLAFN